VLITNITGLTRWETRLRVHLSLDILVTLSVPSYCGDSGLDIKEQVGRERSIENYSECRLIYEGKDVGNRDRLSDLDITDTEGNLNMLFVQPQELIICVKWGEKTISLPIQADFTVYLLKQRLQLLTCFTAANIDLYYQGSRLEDSADFHSLNMQENAVINIAFKGEIELIIQLFDRRIVSISTANTQSIRSVKDQIRLVVGVYP
jgi:hypothetical protein